MTKTTFIVGLLSAALPLIVLAQSTDDLKNDAATTGDVLSARG